MHPFCRCKATTPMETKEDVQSDIDRLLDGRSIDDIERELDRQIEERDSTLNSVQESANSAEEKSQKQLTFAEKSDIINKKDLML